MGEAAKPLQTRGVATGGVEDEGHFCNQATTPSIPLVQFYDFLLRVSISLRSNVMLKTGTSPVAQWLRICLPMQGTQVRALVQEDPTGRGAPEPVHHNY